MKDLEQHLITKNILGICNTVAQYVCKKKTKQLLSFFLSQYNEYYMNNNLLCMRFICCRIQTLQKHSYSYTKRIVRVTICELFIMLCHLPRYAKINMISNRKYKGDSFTKFPIRFRGKTISNTSYIQGIKHLCNLEGEYEELLNSLLYCCVILYDPSAITTILSKLFRLKTIIKFNMLKHQPELEGIDINDNFVSILCFICLSLCNDDGRYVHCKHIIHMTMIKPGFNMLLMAFNIMSCTDFESKYTDKNSFYFPIILQCCVKIEYIYQELFNTEYKHLQKHLITTTLSSDFDPLFTIPIIKTNHQTIVSEYSPKSKIIILKKKTSDNNISDITKVT